MHKTKNKYIKTKPEPVKNRIFFISAFGEMNQAGNLKVAFEDGSVPVWNAQNNKKQSAPDKA